MKDDELVPVETKVFSAGRKRLQVSVGTNSPKGGPFSKTGSCLHLSLWQIEYNMEWNASIVGDENTIARYRGDEFQAHRPMQVQLNFAGDDECKLAIDALKYAIEVLESQRSGEQVPDRPPYRSHNYGHYEKKQVFVPRNPEKQDDEYQVDTSKWHTLSGPFRKDAEFDHNSDTRAKAKADVDKAINAGAKAVFAISNLEASLWVESSMDGKCRPLEEDMQEKIEASLTLKGAKPDDIDKFLSHFPRGKDEYEGYRD